MPIKVATCVPPQFWLQDQKLKWLDKALETPCDLFLLSQEYFGGGSCREICRSNGITTDDQPITPDWIENHVGDLAHKHQKHIGLGATVNRNGINSEDYLYIDPSGRIVGYHSKIALPIQDNIITNGASKVTPEVDFERACTPVDLPLLGIKAGTVFCWQVYFNQMWQALKDNGCNLVVNCIKWAPRGWYEKGENPDGEECRVGFTQEKGADNPDSDHLGWIRKLRYESEFKELPIAITCNTWDAGGKYLALHGFIERVVEHETLSNLPSFGSKEEILVHEYEPALYDELEHLHTGLYGRFKENWQALMQGTMKRKAVRIERRCINGRMAEQLTKWRANPPRLNKKATPRPGTFEGMFNNG